MAVTKKTRHKLVPGHRVLSPEEAKETLAGLNMKREQLPKLSLKDPIAIEINAKSGDVIEVRRKSPTAGYAIIYRHAIKM